MTIAEFRAWLEGFGASFPMEGQATERCGWNAPRPSADQWNAIKAKLATVGEADRFGSPQRALDAMQSAILPQCYPYQTCSGTTATKGQVP